MPKNSETMNDASPAGQAQVGERPAAWGELLSPATRSVVVVLAAGVFLYAVNTYLATTVQPSLIASIGGLDLYAWTTTVFVFASIAASTGASALMARVGPRHAYRLAGALLTIGTVVCALAPSMPVFLIGRLVQGLGGGTLFALSYSLIHVTLAERLWPRATALLSGMFGIATIVGPAVGGVAAQLHYWRGAFWVLVPVTAYFGLFAAAVLPRRGREGAAVRVPARSVSLLGFSVLVIAAASVSHQPIVNVAGIVVALAGLVAWVTYERHVGGSLLPEETFDARSPLRRIYASMALLILASTVEVYIPYFGQRLHGLDPLLAGYFGAVMAIGWTAGSLLLSGVVRRRGLVMLSAPLFCAGGLIVLAVVGPERSTQPVVIAAFAAGLVLLGWGIGVGWPHLLSGVLSAASERSQDVAGASVTTVQLVATACGSAAAGLITNLAGFTTPGGAVGASHSARALFLVFLLWPVVASIALVSLRRSLDPTASRREAPAAHYGGESAGTDRL